MMKYQTIITVANLAECLNTTDCLILDCRGGVLFDSQKYESFLKSHIPSAVYFCAATEPFKSSDLDSNNLNNATTNKNHVLQNIDEHGFNTDSQIIIYDDDGASDFSNSIWLYLRSIGYKNVAILQGGFNSWVSQGMPVNDQNSVSKKIFNTEPDNNSYLH